MRAAPSLLAIACFLSPAAAARGEVVVEQRGEMLRVRVSAAPLADVLAAFERETGARVTYEGPPPAVTVTLAFDADTPAEAVRRMFEGLGLSYVVGLDERGWAVKAMFVLAGTGANGRSGAGSVVASAHVEAPLAAIPAPGADAEGVGEEFQEVARPRATELRSPPPQDDGEPPPTVEPPPVNRGQEGPVQLPKPRPGSRALPNPSPAGTDQ